MWFIDVSVWSFCTTSSSSLPCAPNEVVGMTAHSEKIIRIQEELLRIIQDEEFKTAVELLADLIKDILKKSNDLSGLHFEVDRFIPNDNQYDKSYWMAAYILYLNGYDFIKLCKEVEAIDEEIIMVHEYLQMLDKELQASQEAVWALYKYVDKQSAFLEKVSKNANALYKKLISPHKGIDRTLYNSILERYDLLEDIVQSIEDRIEKANKEIEEADKDMGRMKEEYEAVRKHLEELEREKWRILDLIRDFVEEMESS